jgi:hypothetical protein
MPSDVIHLPSYFVHLGIILMLALGFYSGLSGRVRTVYLCSLCVVSLLSSRFTASALLWFYDFLKYEYLVFNFFISLTTVFVCRSSWILMNEPTNNILCFRAYVVWAGYHFTTGPHLATHCL